MDHIYQLSKHITKFYPTGNDWDWGKGKSEYYQDFQNLIASIKIGGLSDMKSLIKNLSVKSHELKKAIKEAHRGKTKVPLTEYLNVKYVLRHLFLAYGDLRNIQRNKIEGKVNEYSNYTMFVHGLNHKNIPVDKIDSLRRGINESFISELCSFKTKEIEHAK